MRNWGLRAILPSQIAEEFYRDIPVWEAKVYRQRPLLCHIEGDIVRIRNWAQQFYQAPAQADVR